MDFKHPRRDSKESLTNEALSKRFGSTFELVNYAIRRAADMIASGNIPRLHIDHEQNIANAILSQISEGKDRLQKIHRKTEYEVEEIIQEKMVVIQEDV